MIIYVICLLCFAVVVLIAQGILLKNKDIPPTLKMPVSLTMTFVILLSCAVALYIYFGGAV